MSDVPLANWNGEELPLDQVKVSVLDRAFLFGDAVYEALRVYRGRAWLCREHMDRLCRSLREMRIDVDVERLERRMHETLEHSGVQEGLIYLQVTRGEAPRTHYFPKQPVQPNELIYVKALEGDPYAEYRESGARVISHPDLRWGRRDIKSVNLLANCLAAQAAAEAGCAEAILVSPTGEIHEGTHTNLFGVCKGQLMTSPNGPHILPGVTRGLVLHLAQRAEIPIVEQHLTTDNLPTVDELFLTGTTTEVLPVVAVDGQPVGDGKPGAVTQRLYRTYQDVVREWLAASNAD